MSSAGSTCQAELTGMRGSNGLVSTWQGATSARVRVDCATEIRQSVLLEVNKVIVSNTTEYTQLEPNTW